MTDLIRAERHRTVFYIACVILFVGLLAAAALSSRDAERHKALNAEYDAANSMFTNQEFENAYEVYKRLSATYPDAYVLELKMAICQMNLSNFDTGVAHAARALELYPLLARDVDFMDVLAYSLNELGDREAAAYVESYYSNHSEPLPGQAALLG